jgi:hypothetical protein
VGGVLVYENKEPEGTEVQAFLVVQGLKKFIMVPLLLYNIFIQLQLTGFVALWLARVEMRAGPPSRAKFCCVEVLLYQVTYDS